MKLSLVFGIFTAANIGAAKWLKFHDSPTGKRHTLSLSSVRAINHLKTPPNWHGVRAGSFIEAPEFCAALKGLSWLTTTSRLDLVALKPENITTPADIKHQRGPFYRVIRAMMIWEKILKVLELQLWHNRPFKEETQLRFANCYTEQWLDHFAEKGKLFESNSEARCLAFVHLNSLYRRYGLFALRLYYGTSWIAPHLNGRRLIKDARFPEKMPDWWNTDHERVRAGNLVHVWLAQQDSVYHKKHEKFEQARIAWGCESLAEQLKIDMERQQVAEGSRIEAVSLATRFGRDDVLENFYKPASKGKDQVNGVAN